MCAQLFSAYAKEEENCMFESRQASNGKKYGRNLLLLYVLYFCMFYTVHSSLCVRLKFVFIKNKAKDTAKALTLGCLSMSSFHQNQSKNTPGMTEESVLRF